MLFQKLEWWNKLAVVWGNTLIASGPITIMEFHININLWISFWRPHLLYCCLETSSPQNRQTEASIALADWHSACSLWVDFISTVITWKHKQILVRRSYFCKKCPTTKKEYRFKSKQHGWSCGCGTFCWSCFRVSIERSGRDIFVKKTIAAHKRLKTIV